MPVISKSFHFDPLDILIFRDGMPFNQDDSGQMRMHSIFPPNQESVIGALRAAYARGQGWQSGNWADAKKMKTSLPPEQDKNELSRRLVDNLGDGADITDAALTFGAVYLMINREGKWQRLYPIPHDYGVNQKDKEIGEELKNQTLEEITISSLLLTKSKATFDNKCNWIAQTKDVDIYLTLLHHHWVTKETLEKILEGKGKIKTNDIYYGPKSDYDSLLDKQFTPLWSEETRTGIQRCHQSHTVIEGMLYQMNAIRLEDDVILGLDVEIKKEKPIAGWSPQSCTPLGAEAKMATITESKNIDSAVNVFTPEYSKKYAITFISPALVDANKFVIGEKWQELGLSEFLGAAMGRPLVRGAWSSFSGSQRNETLIPPGATLYFYGSAPDGRTMSLGEKQEWGYGRYILRNYQEG